MRLVMPRGDRASESLGKTGLSRGRKEQVIGLFLVFRPLRSAFGYRQRLGNGKANPIGYRLSAQLVATRAPPRAITTETHPCTPCEISVG